ncbi:MAG: NADH-quinone oxidoreductase subunit M [Phycisphaerales bacterium]|nr:NADH-quinone oxidoreductase subunit M [Planctomycetota bacterium]
MNPDTTAPTPDAASLLDQWMLGLLVLVPLAFALVVAFSPDKRARATALLGTLAAGLLTVVALARFSWSNGAAFQFEHDVHWLPSLGISVSMGADSVSMLLVALTALLGPICVLASWTAITERVRLYFVSFLILQAAMVGVFIARDIIFFYICFEFTLIPMYVLVSQWGSTERKRAATTFFLYTFTGSVITLAGLVYVAWINAGMAPGLYAGSGSWTFQIATLQITASQHMTLSQQSWVLLALLAGFAVKVPLFPVHTWLPLTHTQAPTAGSVILAGVLLKLGTYGIFRFAIPFCPDAFMHYAPVIATLCIIGILYGGLICWVQEDVKKLVAYSSVAHLGFCVLGLAALNVAGLQGSILYMINHGLSTGALFLLVGFMYERYHTRSMKEIGGLAAKMPVWATFMVFFVMASVGLPGLNGFVSEFLCILGTFQASDKWATGVWGSAGTAIPGATAGNLGPWYALVAGSGVIVAAMYLLIMVGKVVFGPLKEPAGHGGAHGHDEHHGHEDAHATEAHLPADLTAREITALLPLAVACLVFGVFPAPLLSALKGPVDQTVALIDTARQIPPPGTPSTQTAAADLRTLEHEPKEASR